MIIQAQRKAGHRRAIQLARVVVLLRLYFRQVEKGQAGAVDADVHQQERLIGESQEVVQSLVWQKVVALDADLHRVKVG